MGTRITRRIAVNLTITEEQHTRTITDPLLSDPWDPLHRSLARLIDDVPIQDVREMDIFEALRRKIHNLKEIPSGFFEGIWENKEEISKVPVMKDLLREFILIIYDTTNFYDKLATCLSREKAKHDIIRTALEDVAPPGSPPLNEAEMNIVREELNAFLQNEDPFKDLHQEYEPLLGRYDQLYNNLNEKIKELSKNRKKNRLWHIVSGALSVVVTAATAVTCVVVAVVAPQTAPVMTTALTLYTASITHVGKYMMDSYSRKDKNYAGAEHLAEKIKNHTCTNHFNLKKVDGSEKRLNQFRKPIVEYVENYVQDHGTLHLAKIAMTIKDKVEELFQNIDGLKKKVDDCMVELTEQIENLEKFFF